MAGSHTADFITPGATTWKAPSVAIDGFDVTSIQIDCWAGGGGSGTGTTFGGGGGGGGGFSRKTQAVTPGVTYNLNVAAAGATGGTGGNSWFSATNEGAATCRALGGTGGGNGSTLSGGTAGSGGALGTGDTRFTGGNAAAGSLATGGGGGGGAGTTGNGGNASSGTGGTGTSVGGGNGGGSAADGSTNGGGGGGGSTTSSAAHTGTRGEVLVTYAEVFYRTLSAIAVGRTSGYRREVLADTPSMYLPLDAAALGTDLSGNGRNGSSSGGISFGAFAASPITNETTSTDFDGTDDAITSSYNPFTNGTSRTFEGWAYRDTSTNTHRLFGGDANSINAPILTLLSGATATVEWYPGGVGAAACSWASAWPGSSQWVHWALTFNESTDTGELFINGVSQGTRTTAGQYLASPGNLLIGKWGAVLYPVPWDGRMAHFAVYGSILSSSRIAARARFAAAGDFVKSVGLPRSATAVGVSAFTRLNTLARSFSATAVGVSAFARALTAARSFASTAIGIAAVTKKVGKPFAATAVGVVTTPLKQVGKSFAATTVGAASINKAVAKTFSAVAIGIAGFARAVILARSFSATAVGRARAYVTLLVELLPPTSGTTVKKVINFIFDD